MSYDTKEDVFTFVITLKGGPMTKRGILRITCSLFDPLGFLIPFLLKAKLLIQELWRLELEWDEVLDENQQRYWKKMVRRCEECVRDSLV